MPNRFRLLKSKKSLNLKHLTFMEQNKLHKDCRFSIYLFCLFIPQSNKMLIKNRLNCIRKIRPLCNLKKIYLLEDFVCVNDCGRLICI